MSKFKVDQDAWAHFYSMDKSSRLETYNYRLLVQEPF